MNLNVYLLVIFLLTFIPQNECSTWFESTLYQIKETGKIRIGVYNDSFPYSYLDETTNQYIGYTMDICQIIINNVKEKIKMRYLKVEYVVLTYENRFDRLINNEYDLECDGSTNNKFRQLMVEFSYTTVFDEIRLLVRSDSQITSLSDLNNQVVVTVQATTAEKAISDYASLNNLNIIVESAATEPEAFDVLATNNSVAFVYEVTTLSFFSAQFPGVYEIVGQPLAYDPTSVFYRKFDPKFAYVVNEAVLKVIKTGLIRALYEKWFLEPIPPNGFSLGLVASCETEFAWSDPNTLPSETYPICNSTIF